MKILLPVDGSELSLEAVRFDGDRGYAVTFFRTDPLFVFDLADPAYEPQSHRLGIMSRYRFGASLPSIENRAELFLVAEGVRPVGFDHEGVTPVAGGIVEGEVGMNGFRDVHHRGVADLPAPTARPSRGSRPGRVWFGIACRRAA